MKSDKRGIAFHLAAHTLMALESKIKVQDLTIDEMAWAGDGCGWMGGISKRQAAASRDFPRLQQLMLTAISGPIAEARACDVLPKDLLRPTDYAIAVGFAREATSDAEEADALLAWLHLRATHAVDASWWAITAIAERLMLQSHLTADSALKAVRRCAARRVRYDTLDFGPYSD